MAEPAALFVVEDDAALLDALIFSFEIEGYHVRAYPNGEAFLAEAALPLEGCLVLDYKLPGLNGLEVLARLRSCGVALPAVLITTATPFIQEQAAAMAVPLIEKPLLDGLLFEKIRSLLRAQADARV